MNNSFFLYDDELSNSIKQLSFNTNILEQYDNVTYHANLFCYSQDVQKEIETTLAEKGFYEPNIDKRIYICRDGVTTKFTIPSFSLKNVFGNIQAPNNIGTFEIKMKIQETLSCMLSNELEVLAYRLGYDGYLGLPYWFEIYFSGFEHNTLKPISRIPLPNGENSLIFEGFIGTVTSNLESSGTTWDVTFVPNQNALVNKLTNILSVATVIKDNNIIKLEDFLKACADNMFERMIYQTASTEKEKNDITSLYNGKPYINITLKGAGDNDIEVTSKNDSSKIVTQEEIEKAKEAIKQKEEKDKEKEGDKSSTISDQDMSELTASLNSSNYITSNTTLFTTICQDFLFNTKNYKSYIAKYDIKPVMINYYNYKPIYYYKIVITIEKDEYIADKLEELEGNGNPNKFNAVNFFSKKVKNKSLIKRYQYGYSGVDTSVLEASNKYDRLYFMNAIPSTTLEYSKNDVNNRYNNNYTTKADKQNDKTQDDKTKEQADKTQTNKSFTSNITESLNLEDIYSTLSQGLANTDYFKISFLNKIPSYNNDLTNDNKRNSSSSNIEDSRKEVSAKILWDRLYKNGQMSETKFTILGDPYWIATQAFRTKANYEKKEDDRLRDFLIARTFYTPDYRFVFTIKSTPDQNQSYNVKNPTDYDFEYSMHASGIYMIVDCESIFEDGKFTQKIFGVLDERFIKKSIKT